MWSADLPKLYHRRETSVAKVKECNQAYDNDLGKLKGKTHWYARCKRHVLAVLNIPVIMLQEIKQVLFVAKNRLFPLKPTYVPLLGFPPLPLINL